MTLFYSNQTCVFLLNLLCTAEIYFYQILKFQEEKWMFQLMIIQICNIRYNTKYIISVLTRLWNLQDNFIKISSGHSFIINLMFIKFFKAIWEIGGQMSWDLCRIESLIMNQMDFKNTTSLFFLVMYTTLQWTSRNVLYNCKLKLQNKILSKIIYICRPYTIFGQQYKIHFFFKYFIHYIIYYFSLHT